MSKIMLIFSFVFLLLPIFVMAKPTITILDFDIEKNAIVLNEKYAVKGVIEDRTKMLSSDLVTQIVNTRKFDVIERDRIDTVLKEQEFSANGMVDPHKAIKLGKLIGVDYLVMGRIEVIRAERKSKLIPYTDYVKHTTIGDLVVNVRIVESRTGKIVSAKKVKTHENLSGNISAEVFIDKLKENCVRQIVSEVINGVFPIKIVGVSGDSVFLNRGEGAANFNIGDVFDVYQMGEEMIDPDTGESIGSAETKIGQIVITSIQPKKSVANIIKMIEQSNPIGSICRKTTKIINNSSNADQKHTPSPATQRQHAPNW